MNLRLILKALGVKIEDADIEQIEKLIPKIPGLAQRLIELANGVVVKINETDARLARIEEKLGITHEPIGIGTTTNGNDNSNGTTG